MNLSSQSHIHQPRAGNKASLVYRVNSLDAISFVSPEWDRFAVENQAQALVSNRILQRNLWDFISHETTRQLYTKMLANARQGREIWFDFRCDSPCLRRLLRMHLSGARSGEVELRSEVIAETPRPVQLLLDTNSCRTNRLLTMCSWCNRVNVEGDWSEVEEAVCRLNLFSESDLPALTHGICEPCTDRFLAIADS